MAPPVPASADPAEGDEGALAKPPPWFLILAVITAVSVFWILVYAVGDRHELAVAAFVASGACVAGGFLGFLFGIPRSLAGQDRPSGDEAPRPGYGANTNLEQISDWLTKILVGVGLVQFAAFASHLGDLVRFLGPTFGKSPLGETFAASILAFFSVGGFLTFYLCTRIYLPRAFAQADQGTVRRVVQIEIAQVQQTQREQEANELKALTLVAGQLEPEPGAPSIAQADLNAAVAAASPLVKAQLFNRAREQRRQTWKTDKAKMERTIPVFRALVASEGDEKFHRNHAQLGYALKDRQVPDLETAEAELTEAIRLRDEEGAAGFLLYEFNRALTRIARYGVGATPEQRAQIEADLNAAAASPYLKKRINTNTAIKDFRAASQPS